MRSLSLSKYFYTLIENPYRKSDINEALKVLKSRRLTIGPVTDKFQNSFTKKLGSNFSLMVNSGSSAKIFIYSFHLESYHQLIH